MSPYLAFDVKIVHCLSQPFMRIADLLIKRNCWQNVLQQYDFWPSELHEKILTLPGKIRLSSLFSKINWSYNVTMCQPPFEIRKSGKNQTDIALIISIMVSKWRSRMWLPHGVFGFDILFIDIKRWPKY